MGLIREKDLLLRFGEFPMKSGETWYGGSPLAVYNTGEIVLAKAGQLGAANGDATGARFLGIAWTTSTEVKKTLNSIATAIVGPVIVTLCSLTKADATTFNYSNPGGTPGIEGDSYPYDNSLTYAVGDRMYISSAGLWTNSPASAGDPYYGFVRAKTTSTLQIIFYGAPVTKP